MTSIRRKCSELTAKQLVRNRNPMSWQYYRSELLDWVASTTIQLKRTSPQSKPSTSCKYNQTLPFWPRRINKHRRTNRNRLDQPNQMKTSMWCHQRTETDSEWITIFVQFVQDKSRAHRAVAVLPLPVFCRRWWMWSNDPAILIDAVNGRHLLSLANMIDLWSNCIRCAGMFDNLKELK